jgi:hypothetical protein
MSWLNYAWELWDIVSSSVVSWWQGPQLQNENLMNIVNNIANNPPANVVNNIINNPFGNLVNSIANNPAASLLDNIIAQGPVRAPIRAPVQAHVQLFEGGGNPAVQLALEHYDIAHLPQPPRPNLINRQAAYAEIWDEVLNRVYGVELQRHVGTPHTLTLSSPRGVPLS